MIPEALQQLEKNNCGNTCIVAKHIPTPDATRRIRRSDTNRRMHLCENAASATAHVQVVGHRLSGGTKPKKATAARWADHKGAISRQYTVSWNKYGRILRPVRDWRRRGSAVLQTEVLLSGFPRMERLSLTSATVSHLKCWTM